MTLSYQNIRQINFSKHRKRIKSYINVDINDWYRNPYAGPKARFYSEVSSIIILFNLSNCYPIMGRNRTDHSVRPSVTKNEGHCWSLLYSYG